MQTFLTCFSFDRTAEELDYKRLGKQRVEAFQILNILNGKNPESRWRNHPAVLMWKGHELLLEGYMYCMIREWVRRGYNNTMHYIDPIKFFNTNNIVLTPDWWFDFRLTSSHRSNLLRKDPTYYGKFGWVEPNNLPYYWPVKKQ